MSYLALKHLHMLAVALSALGFIARGSAALAGAAWVRSRPARVLPHVIDTVLLASAIALAVQLGLNPVHAPWLMAKIVGLLVYIGLGVVALRPGTPLGRRLSAFVAALLVLGYIVSVAITKQPGGYFA